MPGSLRQRRRDVRSACAGDSYALLHAPRYAELLTLLDTYIRPDSRVLDIGRSRLTRLMHETYGVPVDSLGFAKNGPTAEGTNYWFDLNRAQDEQQWRRDIPAYDVVVMAEVIEHLYTSPLLVLRFLRTLVADNGVLIVQTPNAVALHKRAKMLIGRHPFETIREDTTNPGHFREYTRRELESVAREAGFSVERWMAKAYFDYRYVAELRGRSDDRKLRTAGALLNAAYAATPARLRPGQTVVLRKP
jgi:SAM-dependent methyltransferase